MALVILLVVVLGLQLLLFPMLPWPPVLPALLLSLMPLLVSRLPVLVPFAGEVALVQRLPASVPVGGEIPLVRQRCSAGVGFAWVF